MPVTQRLADALRHQRAYVTIYEQYLLQQPRPDFRALLEALRDDTLASAETLAQLLRRMGERPTEAAPPQRLVQLGITRKGTISQLEFIVQGLQNTLSYCQTQQAQSDDDAAQAMWTQLLETQQRHLPPLQALLDKVQHPERE